MKYRWTTNVMTRHSGIMTIYCKDRKQAESNINQYINNRIASKATIGFDSIADTLNVLVMDEIIGVSVGDMQLVLDIHQEEIEEHQRTHRDASFSQENNYEDL